MSHSPLYELHISLRSPFARRVRSALHRLAEPQDVTTVVHNVFEPTVELYLLNPLGQVPILVDTHRGATIPDSTLILDYLHDAGGLPIYPTDVFTRIKVKRLSCLSVGLMEFTVRIVLERARSNFKLDGNEWIQENLDNIDRTLQSLAKHDFENAPWRLNHETSQCLWDLAIALDYLKLRVPDLHWWDQYPSLKVAYDSLSVHPSFLATSPPAV